MTLTKGNQPLSALDKAGIRDQIGLYDGENPLLACAHWGKVPDLVRVATSLQVRAETRDKIALGAADLSEIRLVYCGYNIIGGQGDELALPNAQSIQVALEIPAVGTVQFKFNGQLQGSIPAGAAEYRTDPLYPSDFGLTKFPANSTYWVREQRSVAVGESYARCSTTNNLTGEATVYTDGSYAPQLLGTGALINPSGGAINAREFLPAVIVGRAISNPDVAVVQIGDSLLNGSNDTAGGYLTRALQSVNGRSIPMTKMTADGSGTFWFVLSYARRYQLLRYFSHLVCNYGTNDLAAGAGLPAATVFANLQTIWKAARAAGITRVEQILIIPRTASTDSWATVANQTPGTGFETGGARRDALNALITGAVGSYGLDAARPVTAFADATSLDKWPAGYTIDGVHPSPTASSLPVASFVAWMSGWFYQR